MPSSKQIWQWQARSRSEKLAARHAIRARDLNGGKWCGSWSAAQWERLIAFVGSICYWCGEHTDQPEPDHYIPLARGGRNSIDNLVVSCPHCNSQRQDKLPDEYWAWLDDCEQASWTVGIRRYSSGSAGDMPGPDPLSAYVKRVSRVYQSAASRAPAVKVW